MQFYRRTSKSAGVPIVPMIDILTILLIFFIIHTQWKKTPNVLKINVPTMEYIEGSKNKDVRDILSVSGSSEIYLNGEKQTKTSLITALQKLKDSNPDLKLQLDLDQDASFGTLADIWDALTAVDIDVNKVPARIEAVKTSN